MSRTDDIRRFYDLLAEVEHRAGGRRRLADCNGRMPWPDRGVYFFMEPGETRSQSGDGDRVVRVGTHALKLGSRTKLWGRLSQHRGPSSGAGNHRGSIFRLLLGDALLRRDNRAIASWGFSGSRNEAARRLERPARSLKEDEEPLEIEVSRRLGDMTCIWIDVPDDPGPFSLRGSIERNAIALLSNLGRDPIDPPSDGWLGRSSSRQAVSGSGLWNNNHVGESPDASFFDYLRAAR